MLCLNYRKTALLLLSALFCLFAEGKETFRNVFIYNGDYSLIRNGKLLFWETSNRDWPGTLQKMTTPGDGTFLAITPLPSPTVKDKNGVPGRLAMVSNLTRFLAGRENKVRLRFQFRIHEPSAAGSYFTIAGKTTRGSSVSLGTLRRAKPVPGKWIQFDTVTKLSPRLQKEEECYLTLCISGGRVDIKDMKMEIAYPNTGAKSK